MSRVANGRIRKEKKNNMIEMHFKDEPEDVALKKKKKLIYVVFRRVGDKKKQKESDIDRTRTCDPRTDYAQCAENRTGIDF